MIVYKIRHKKTGLFSRGGEDASRCQSCWDKKGKTWSGLGPLRNHMNQFIGEKALSEWEVITIERTETVVKVADSAEMLNPKKIVELLKK